MTRPSASVVSTSDSLLRLALACHGVTAPKLAFLPNLLRPPPGLSLEPVCKWGLLQESEEDRDACGSDCSTIDTTEAQGTSTTEMDYILGQVLLSACDSPEASKGLGTNRQKPVLELEKALSAPCGSPACPSIGSARHHLGFCKPCDFMYRTTCRAGYSCNFCHLCGPDENKLRKKQRQSLLKTARRTQAYQDATAVATASWMLSTRALPHPLPSYSSAQQSNAGSAQVLRLDQLIQVAR